MHINLKHLMSCLAFQLLVAGCAWSVSVDFSQSQYQVRPGESIELITSFSEPIPNGLEGYALKLAFPPGSLTLSTERISVPPELDFDLFDPGADRGIGLGYASVAGYVELGQAAYSGTRFAVFRITVPKSALAGFHTLQLGKLLPVGVNFVDGLGNSIDDILQFGSASLEILSPRPPEVIGDLTIKLDGQTATLAFSGVPGERYAIHSTPDLKAGNWTVLAVITAPEDGFVEFTDTFTNESGARFYKIKAP